MVNLPSAELSVPPDGHIDAVVISPLGIPTAVIMGVGLCGVSAGLLFLQDMKKVEEKSIIAINLRTDFEVFIIFRIKLKLSTKMIDLYSLISSVYNTQKSLLPME